MIPGEYLLKKEDIVCNKGRMITSLTVVNTGDRPVQVGSHFHFFESNRMLEFDREKAFGLRLNIASGTAVRFEPGEEKKIALIPFGGNKKVFGINNLTNGDTTSIKNKAASLEKSFKQHFKNKPYEPEH